MSETLIVIATHGGADLLRESLPKFAGHNVVVAETGTRNADVSAVCKEHKVFRICTPYKGYDTGAYLHAFRHIVADNYLFLQDSVCPREPDFVEQFQRAMPSESGIVGWSSFDMSIWDSLEQKVATAWMYGRPHLWPSHGIFGPIFYTSRKTLQNMDEQGLLPMPPFHKEQQQAMERAWAILAHRAGVPVRFLVEEDMPRGAAMERGEYPALTKTFRVRA